MMSLIKNELLMVSVLIPLVSVEAEVSETLELESSDGTSRYTEKSESKDL